MKFEIAKMADQQKQPNLANIFYRSWPQNLQMIIFILVYQVYRFIKNCGWEFELLSIS